MALNARDSKMEQWRMGAGSGGPMGLQPGGPGEALMPGAGRGAGPDQWLAMLQAFFAEMNKPLDLNDPLVQNILTGARTSAMSDAASRGIHGGYSTAMGERAYIDAAAQQQMQRKQLGLQALGMGLPGSIQQAENQYGADMNSYLKQQRGAQGIGGLIGGGLGALGGFALGGPAGAAGGFQLGSNIGAGIGGQFGGGGPPPSYGGRRPYGGV